MTMNFPVCVFRESKEKKKKTEPFDRIGNNIANLRQFAIHTPLTRWYNKSSYLVIIGDNERKLHVLSVWYHNKATETIIKRDFLKKERKKNKL